MSSRNRRWKLVALVALAALVLAACGRDDDDDQATAPRDTQQEDGGSDAGGADDGETEYPDQGISDDEIILGSTYPFSGPVSGFAGQGKGVAAYFEYINDTEGGITFGDGKKRKVKFITYDDAYEPQRALEGAKKLVEQDGIFAFFNTFGTPPNGAIAPYAHEEGVPMVYVSSSSAEWGNAEKWPLAIICCPAGSTEGPIIANYLKEEKPDAKVALLYQNDDFGKGATEGFKATVEGSGIEIVAEQTYEVSDPTVDSQVTNLAASGADTFFLVATPKFGALALQKAHEIGWEPLRMVQTAASSVKNVLEPVGFDVAKGLISLSWYKDVTDPRWEDDEGMQLFKEQAPKYGADANDPFSGSGWLVAEAGHRLFEQMEEPTRDGLVEAYEKLDTDDVALMLPGMRLKTGPGDRFPMETMYLMEFDGTSWVLFDEPVSAEGQTPT